MDYDPADGSGPIPANPEPHQHIWVPIRQDENGNYIYGACGCGAPHPG